MRMFVDDLFDFGHDTY